MKNTQVLAGPRRRKFCIPCAKFGYMVHMVTNGAADWIADAVSQYTLGQRTEMATFARAATRLGVLCGPFGAEHLRLNLGNLDEIHVCAEEVIESPEVNCAGAEPRRNKEHLAELN